MCFLLTGQHSILYKYTKQLFYRQKLIYIFIIYFNKKIVII